MPANLFMKWIKSIGNKFLGNESRRERRSRVNAQNRRTQSRWRPTFEQLEDRIVPAYWLITSATDSASPTLGMLRYAITHSVAGDTIAFSPSLSGSTITLSSALTIGHNLTITGFSSSSNLVIAGTASFVDVIVSSGVTASISGLSIENGLSTSGNGIRNKGTLSLSNDTITGNGSSTNTGSHKGGGIYNAASSTMDINDCTITNNTSYYNGGGIQNNGTMTVTNSSICGNAAFTDGGGIDNVGTLTLANDTISGNDGWSGTASEPTAGGGIFSTAADTVTMFNTIVAGNITSGTGPQIDKAIVASSSNNLVGVGTGMTGITNGTNGNQVGTAAAPVNPLLGSLAGNGGATQTESLGTGSPAIGKGGAVTTVGTAGIAATGNSIVLTSGAAIGNMSGLAIPIQIDSEQMLVTAVSGTTLTVVRGYNGTTPATHASGASVYLLLDQRGYAITPPTTTPDVGAYQSAGTAPNTPTVTGISPLEGPATGGTTVTITGTNLQNATAVDFGYVMGTIVSDTGTTIVATTPAEQGGLVDTTVTTAGWDTSATSPADQFLIGPTYASSLVNGALSITQETSTNTGTLNFSLSGGNYIFADSSGNVFDFPTGNGAGYITGAGSSTIAIPSADVTSISVVLGAGTNVFNFAGTGGSAAVPISVNTGTTTGDQVNFTGATLDSGAVSLTTNAIGESGTGSLGTSGTLTTSTVTGAVLATNASAIGIFNATNSGAGPVNLLDSGATLAISGISDTTSGGSVTVNNSGGALSISSISAGSNAVNLSASTSITETASPTLIAGALGLTAGSIAAAGQPLLFTATTVSTNTSAGNGAQFLSYSGTVGLSVANALNAGTGTVTLTGGTFQALSAGVISGASTVNLSAPAILDLDGSSQAIGGLTGAGTVIDSGAAATLTVTGGGLFSGAITGTNTSLTVAGTSQPLTLSGASGTNTYAGATTIQSGTLQLGATNTLPTTTAVTFGSSATNGTLDLNGYNQTIAGLSVASSVPQASDASQVIGDSSTSAGSILTVTGTTAFAGTIQDDLGSGTKQVTVDVTGGTVNLGGTDTYSGGTNIISGTLQAGSNTALSAASILSFGSVSTNGTLDLNGFSPTVGGLAIAAGATAASQVIGNSSTTAPGTLVFNTGTSTFAGTIQNVLGSGTQTTGLTIAGGSLELTGTDTYTGTTTVNAGQLLVDSSIASSAVSVTGGVLGGVGTVGAITATGGTVDPGDTASSPAILTASSANFSTADLTLGISALTTAGSGYDQLNLGSGTLTLGSTSVLTLNLAGLNNSGTIDNIIAYGGETGTFATVNLINNPNNLQAILTYTSTGLNLTIVAPATHFQVTGLSGSTVAGTPLTVTVTALDAYNNVASLYTGTVHFTSTDTNSQTVLPTNYTFTTGASGDNGVHTFTGLTQLVTAGSQTVTATDTSSSGIVGTSGTVTITSAAASQLVVAQQPSGTAIAGAAFGTQPVVKEEDTYGNVITTDSTDTVTAARGSLGSGSLQGSPLTVTLANGVATFGGLFYDVAETMNLSFSTNAGSFTATSTSIAVNPAAGTQLVIATQPSATAIAGAVFGTQPVVEEEDLYGNVVTTDSTHTVTVARGSLGTGSLQGSPLTVTLASGVATFSGLAYDVAETMNLNFTTNAGSFTATSSSIAVTPASASQLVVAQQPSGTAIAGAAFGTQPVVEEEDLYGNVVITDSTHTVTVARGSLGTGSLQGSPLTVTLSSGVASFSGLSYDIAQTMNLGFTTNAGSFTATSTSIAVNPSVGTQLVIATQPSATAIAGAAFGTQPVVQEEDVYGNIVTTDSTHTVTVARGSLGSGSLQGSSLTVTLASGVATFSGLSYDVAQTMNLGFTTNAGSFTATSSSVAVNPSVGTQLVIATQPSATATAGTAFGTQPVVEEEDVYGNIVTTDSTHTVTVARGSLGTGSLQGSPLTVTLSSGVAAFSGLSYDIAETMNLNFTTTAGSFTAASASIAVTPAAATQLVVAQQPSGTATAGAAFGTQPVVKEEDVYGNVITSDSTHTVTVSRGSVGTGSLQGSPLTVTLSNGVAAFSGLFYDVAETMNLSFSTNAGSFTAASNNIAVNPAAPTVVTPAAANPSPVTGTTAALSVLGASVDTSNSTLTYTWAAIGAPAAVSFSANGTNAAQNTTAVFSAAGTYNFQVTITDTFGLSTTSTLLNVMVNQTFTSMTVTPASISLEAGQTQLFAATGYDQFGAPLVSQPTFTWSTTAGSIDSSGNFVAQDAPGTDTVTAMSGTVSSTATVTVTGVPPAFTSSNSTTFTVGTSGSFSATASGYPAPTFIESGSLPSGVTFTSAGVLSGMPAAATGGMYPITIIAANGLSPDAIQSFTLTVDQAPAITSSTGTTFTVGAVGSFSVTATGYPAESFTETGPLPSGVTLTAAGMLSGTPAAGTGGTYPITIAANNGVSPNATQSFTLTVDQAPAITSANSTTFTVGTPGSFSETASGFPASTFTEYGLLPSGVTLTSAGVLSGTPAAGTGGTYPITITATNSVSPNATQSFTLTVDQAPAITSSAGTTFTVGSSGTFAVTATGYPAESFTETGPLPSGVTLTAAGMLSGTPAAGTGGTYPITLAATNGVSPNATQSFTLTVDQAPAITSANSTTFTVGADGSFSATASGYPAPTFTEIGTLPSGVTLSTAGVLSGTPASGAGVSYSIVIEASNGVSPEASQAFTLTVDHAPAITSASGTTLTVGTAGSFAVTASGYPSSTFTESGPLPSGVTLSTAGVLSGTPAAGTGGTYPITIAATNGVSPDATQSFTLTVDQAPAITSANTTTFAVGTSGSFSETASGFPTPTFTEYGLLPSGVTLTSAGVLSGTPAAGTGGTYPITITATNGVSPHASQSFTLTVEQAPAITSSTGTTFTVGSSGLFTVTATGYPASTFTESGPLPSGVTLTAAGVLSGTPAAGAGGTYPITIAATNGISPDATQSFTLTVDEAPAITSANSTTFTVGASGSLAVTASGYPTPTFTEIGALPSGVTLTSAGVLSGTPVAGTGGSYSIVLEASNGVSPEASQTFTLTVDQAPAITSSTGTTFTAGSSGSFAVTATGYPTSTFTESGPLPSGVTLSTAGVLTGTPAVGTGGTYPITLTATNGISPNATQSFTLTVDQAPVITSANTTTFTVGASGSLSVTASGYPAPTFTEIGSLPSGVTLTSAGVLSGTPVAGTGGSYSIVLEASNGVSPDASQTFTLTVDQAPAITSATATTFAAGKSGSFAVTATGYPAESFSETGPLPTGVTLTAAGVLSGTPAAGTGGTYPITITATNGISPDATQSFTLTVDQAPAITSANTTTFTVGASGSLAVTASGYPAPTFTEIGALPSGVTLTSAGVLSGTPAAGTGGSYAIVIEATNGTPPDASQAFTLTVDQAPAITSSASTGFSIGSSGSFAVTASGYPAATLSETGPLPSGVTLTAAGVLSGTPAAGTAGTYPITITAANGIAPAATQSFTLTIGQAPGLSNSFVTVSPGSVAAGATTTITLQAVDTYGNDLTVGGLHVVFALGGGTGQGTITAATDNGNGTYTATFTGQIAGSNTITATIGGQPVTSAAPTLTVTPGTISITHSQVSTALPSVQLGGETTIVLQGEDSYGNLETTGGATNIAFELENSTGGHGTISSVKDNGNGTYTAIFIGTVDGPNTIEATIGGSPATSTTPVSVTGAAVNLADSLLSVAAATVQSGSGIQVSLQAESAKGVKETSGGLIVAFGLGSGSGGQGTFGPVSYLGNGVYTATFTGTLAGKNTIIATIDGLKVTSKAPAISVLPGTLSYSNSLVTVSSASVSAGGTTTTITFQPRDAAGNKLTLKGLPVSFALGGNGTAQGTFSNGGVAVYKNGVYTATFKGTLVGGSTIVTTVNSEAIASNPPVISVTPGTALAANSKLTISEGADTVSSGGTITLMVQAVDANGNLETTGGLKVSFKLASKTGGLGTFGKVTDNKNGTYTVTFTGTTAGTNTIEATIGGKTVSSTVTITVMPEA